MGSFGHFKVDFVRLGSDGRFHYFLIETNFTTVSPSQCRKFRFRLQNFVLDYLEGTFVISKFGFFRTLISLAAEVMLSACRY